MANVDIGLLILLAYVTCWVLTYLTLAPKSINRLFVLNVLWFELKRDCCPGQNKNILMAAMLATVVQELNFEGRKLIINHKFLIPGHTHMEADSIHAAIEKTKNTTTANIEIPRDWANLIRMVPRNPPLMVTEMQQNQFLNFKSLLREGLQHRKKNTVGNSVTWSTIRWMQYRPSEVDHYQVHYKHSFNPIEEFYILDLARKRLRNSSILKLSPLSEILLKLSDKKLKNLQELIPYINVGSRPYYETFLNTLSSSNEVIDFLPDDEEPENCEEDIDD